jgi:hypothetical protein
LLFQSSTPLVLLLAAKQRVPFTLVSHSGGPPNVFTSTVPVAVPSLLYRALPTLK